MASPSRIEALFVKFPDYDPVEEIDAQVEKGEWIIVHTDYDYSGSLDHDVCQVFGGRFEGDDYEPAFTGLEPDGMPVEVGLHYWKEPGFPVAFQTEEAAAEIRDEVADFYGARKAMKSETKFYVRLWELITPRQQDKLLERLEDYEMRIVVQQIRDKIRDKRASDIFNDTLPGDLEKHRGLFDDFG